MKYIECLELQDTLIKYNKMTCNINFAYAVSVNLKKLEAITKSLEDVKPQPSEGLQEMEVKRIEMVRELAEKDENGNPKQENGNFILPSENQKIAEEKFNKLKEEYKDDIDAFHKSIEEYNSLLESDIKEDISLRKCSLKYFPEQISASDMAILEIMVKDEEESE